jgi:t-SNARE complex subunit (syntaxin)
VVKVTTGAGELERANEYSKKAKTMKCIICLVVLIIFLLLILVWKWSSD